MEKMGRFALVVCLGVLGVALVLSITNPDVLPTLGGWAASFGKMAGNVIVKVGRAFACAF